MKNKITKIVFGIALIIFSCGSFSQTAFAANPIPVTREEACRIDHIGTPCTSADLLSFDFRQWLDRMNGYVQAVNPVNIIERTSPQNVIARTFSWLAENIIVKPLTWIASWFLAVFILVIDFLLKAIMWIDAKTYETPQEVFLFWQKLSAIALALVVLAGAFSAFLISTHSAKEEDARTVVGNMVKVVVAIALSWSLCVFVLEQVQILERAIYQTGLPTKSNVKNISTAMNEFNTDFRIAKIGLLDASGDNAGVAVDTGVQTETNKDGFILARLVIQDISLFYFITPLVIVLFTYIIRLAAMYCLLGLAGMAALGLFSPKIRKLFEMWYTKFITVLKIPLILAVFVSVAFILMGVIGDASSKIVANPCTIALFGIFGDGPEEIFKNLVKYTLGVIIIVKGCHIAASNEVTQKAVDAGKKVGEYLRNAATGAPVSYPASN